MKSLHSPSDPNEARLGKFDLSFEFSGDEKAISCETFSKFGLDLYILHSTRMMLWCETEF